MTKIFCSNIKGEILGKPFPKICSCGSRFYSRHDYLEGTSANKRKPLFDYKINQKFVVKEFRDCFRCGFTMMMRIKDRRDQSAAGDSRRDKYRSDVLMLIGQGLKQDEAHKQSLMAARATM